MFRELAVRLLHSAPSRSLGIPRLWRTFLFRTGVFEPEFKAFVSHTATSGRVFVDIGANHGVLASYALHHYDFVCAVEPDPYCISSLSRLSTRHPNLVLCSFGVGANAGVRTFYSTRGSGRSSFTRNRNHAVESAIPLTIPVLDVAWLFSGFVRLFPGRAFVCKIDCEGMDFELLATLIANVEIEAFYVEVGKEWVQQFQSLDLSGFVVRAWRGRSFEALSSLEQSDLARGRVNLFLQRR